MCCRLIGIPELNKKALAAVAAFSVLLVAATLLSIGLASWAVRERNHAEMQKQAAEANFGSLQVEENPGVHARFAGRLANRIDARRMVVLRAVRGVEAEYIHAGGEQLAQDSGRIGGRPQSGYNFCIGHPVELS